MKVTKNKKFIIIVIALFFLVSTAFAFSDKTHKALTENAILDLKTNVTLRPVLHSTNIIVTEGGIAT